MTSIGCAAARQLFQAVQHRARQAAQRLQLCLVVGEFGAGRQAAVHQQIRDLLELAGACDVEDVVAPVVQVVAAAADGAQRGVAGDDAGERHAFLRRWVLRSLMCAPPSGRCRAVVGSCAIGDGQIEDAACGRQLPSRDGFDRKCQFRTSSPAPSRRQPLDGWREAVLLCVAMTPSASVRNFRM